MQRYILMRLLQSLLAMWVMTIVVFGLARLSGDPLEAILPDDATEKDKAITAEALGLNKPLPVQYWIFVSNAVQGDFGKSIRSRLPVSELVLSRVPATFELAILAMTVAVLISVPLGVIAAVNKGKPLDTIARIIAVLGQSTPIFWLGIMLMLLFAVTLNLLPTSGRGGPLTYVLPTFTMGWYPMAGILRLVRSSMLDVLESDYIKLARIKGVSEAAIVWKHGLRNALIPVLTFVAIIFPHILAGAVITETIFSWPGMGRLAYESIAFHDFPVIQMIILIATALYLACNLVVDILYAYLDPRIRY
ncbi:ABC transporter permease [Chloroflexota bacterium]